jgi:2Fe-2S ferredoxin
MVTIVYIEQGGAERQVDVPPGRSAMEGAVMHGVEGIAAECGGACACGTCHAYVGADWIDVVGRAGDDEQEMLAFAEAPRDDSRLLCQITVSPELEGIRIQVAPAPG